jgi:nitroimidazol reductase NimA-like FMN-containing flavoprotein (pyridoxamine 5'-phosphate oxidase superfamily)
VGRSPRIIVRRKPERGIYDRSLIDAILDEALICHVGFVVEGQPYVIPTIHARANDTLLVHGSQASRMLRRLQGGLPMCVAVTILDDLVLARSVFNNSMNYRSVVVLGQAAEVVEASEKLKALRALTEHVVPGRWDEARRPIPKELRATCVLSIPLDEASAKVRTGPPFDDEDDYGLSVWAGLLPLELVPRPPIPDPRLRPGVEPPSYITDYERPRSG